MARLALEIFIIASCLVENLEVNTVGGDRSSNSSVEICSKISPFRENLACGKNAPCSIAYQCFFWYEIFFVSLVALLYDP